MHQHQQHQHLTQQKHSNEHWQTNIAATTCTAEYSLPFNQQEHHHQQQQATQHRHSHMPRKHSHSHSPHPSRHTSPHSRHTSPHSRHTSPHSRHTSPHSRHTSPHSRHTSPHSCHTSPHSRHTSPHGRHTSPHRHSHSHAHGHSHSSPHQSHHHVHDQHQNSTDSVEPFIRNSAPRASVRSASFHMHSHHGHSHHHRRRKRSDNSQPTVHYHGTEVDQNDHLHQSQVLGHNCTRRHRSVTDVSQSSSNACNDPLCTEREIQDIFVQKSTACCSNSRTELAQYFAEDLYGSSSRRPSSCCTSSDYCYQTDSTSLYGSRSSLSRNNSIKSASVVMRKKKSQQRPPSYTSISLRALNASRPNSQMGSLTSVFDRAEQYATNGGGGGGGGGGSDSGKINDSPSKVTIERHTSKDALSNDLPEYACSPSPIRWSFLADGKTDTTKNSNDELRPQQQLMNGSKTVDERPYQRPETIQHKREREREREQLPDKSALKTHRSQSRQYWKSNRSSSDDRPSTSHKCCESPCKYEESTMVQFHQDAEAFNNCCSNYIQCNTYLDQDLQITSEDIHQYLSKGQQQDKGNVLNNTKTYPFQPSNAFEFQYKNNFANNNTATNTLSSVEGTESMRSYDSRYRRNSSKETNLNQNPNTSEGCTSAACAISSCSSTPLTPANINFSSSTNNINIMFSSSLERNDNEVKFINTTTRHANSASVVSTEAHHADYLPYTYPSYDYTNMAANSQFNKPLSIDEIPQEVMQRAEDLMTITTTSSQHSSSLQSPEPSEHHAQGVSFESFDASSAHNLLTSHRGSAGQYTATPTPRSPLSPASPANSSNYSVSINPASSIIYQNYDYPPGLQRIHAHYHSQPDEQNQSHRHHHHHHHHHHMHNLRESFKLTNAFKKVRKRARKYTDFLRKK